MNAITSEARAGAFLDAAPDVTSYFEREGCLFLARAMLLQCLDAIADDPEMKSAHTRREMDWLLSAPGGRSPAPVEVVLQTLGLEAEQEGFVRAALRDPAGVSQRLRVTNDIMRDMASDYAAVHEHEFARLPEFGREEDFDAEHVDERERRIAQQPSCR